MGPELQQNGSAPDLPPTPSLRTTEGIVPAPAHQDKSQPVELVRAVPHLRLLTILRFGAAAWVLLFHLQTMFVVALPRPLSHFANNGAYAMSFFFLLSGAVLAYGYYDLGTRGAAVQRFYLARLARIYPLYAVVHLIGLLWLPIPLSDFPRWAYVNVTSFLGVQSWFPLANTGVNSGSWSVSCEFFFYLLFPGLLPLIRNLPAPCSFRARCFICRFSSVSSGWPILPSPARARSRCSIFHRCSGSRNLSWAW